MKFLLGSFISLGFFSLLFGITLGFIYYYMALYYKNAFLWVFTFIVMSMLFIKYYNKTSIKYSHYSVFLRLFYFLPWHILVFAFVFMFFLIPLIIEGIYSPYIFFLLLLSFIIIMLFLGKGLIFIVRKLL